MVYGDLIIKNTSTFMHMHDELVREIALLKRIRHRNVVSVLDVVVGRTLQDIFMVMEYCEQDMANLLDSMLSANLPRFRPAEGILDLVHLIHHPSSYTASSPSQMLDETTARWCQILA